MGSFFFGGGGGLEFMFRLHLRSPIWQRGELRVEIVHLSDRFIAGGGNKERLHSLFLDFTLYSFNSFVVPGHEALGPLPTDGSIVVSFSCFLSLFPFFLSLNGMKEKRPMGEVRKTTAATTTTNKKKRNEKRNVNERANKKKEARGNQ